MIEGDRIRVSSEGSSLFGREGVIMKLVPGGFNVLLDEDAYKGEYLGSLWFHHSEVEIVQ